MPSEGHQRLRRSESAAAPTVRGSPLTLEELVFVEDVYGSQERQTASFLFGGEQLKHGAVGHFCVCVREPGCTTALSARCLSLFLHFQVFPPKSERLQHDQKLRRQSPVQSVNSSEALSSSLIP